MISHLGVGEECAYVNLVSGNINMRKCERIWGGLGREATATVHLLLPFPTEGLKPREVGSMEIIKLLRI